MGDERVYFRQLQSGRDYGASDPLARQMANFAYLIGDRESGQALVVDPAYDVPALLDALAADGMRLAGVLATHYHPDHVGGQMLGMSITGIAELLARVSVPIHVQAADAQYVRQVTGVSSADLVEHSGADTVLVGSVPVELIHTPGHTPGSQCLLVDGRLLSGDTLFLDGCGRTDLPGGDAAALYHSLHHTLAAVPDETVLFPGHRYSPAPSASLGATRRDNVVFTPADEQQWLARFGR